MHFSVLETPGSQQQCSGEGANEAVGESACSSKNKGPGKSEGVSL